MTTTTWYKINDKRGGVWKPESEPDGWATRPELLSGLDLGALFSIYVSKDHTMSMRALTTALDGRREVVCIRYGSLANEYVVTCYTKTDAMGLLQFLRTTFPLAQIMPQPSVISDDGLLGPTSKKEKKTVKVTTDEGKTGLKDKSDSTGPSNPDDKKKKENSKVEKKKKEEEKEEKRKKEPEKKKEEESSDEDISLPPTPVDNFQLSDAVDLFDDLHPGGEEADPSLGNSNEDVTTSSSSSSSSVGQRTFRTHHKYSPGSWIERYRTAHNHDTSEQLRSAKELLKIAKMYLPSTSIHLQELTHWLMMKVRENPDPIGDAFINEIRSVVEDSSKHLSSSARKPGQNDYENLSGLNKRSFVKLSSGDTIYVVKRTDRDRNKVVNESKSIPGVFAFTPESAAAVGINVSDCELEDVLFVCKRDELWPNLKGRSTLRVEQEVNVPAQEGKMFITSAQFLAAARTTGATHPGGISVGVVSYSADATLSVREAMHQLSSRFKPEKKEVLTILPVLNVDHLSNEALTSLYHVEGDVAPLEDSDPPNVLTTHVRGSPDVMKYVGIPGNRPGLLASIGTKWVVLDVPGVTHKFDKGENCGSRTDEYCCYIINKILGRRTDGRYTFTRRRFGSQSTDEDKVMSGAIGRVTMRKLISVLVSRFWSPEGPLIELNENERDFVVDGFKDALRELPFTGVTMTQSLNHTGHISSSIVVVNGTQRLPWNRK